MVFIPTSIACIRRENTPAMAVTIKTIGGGHEFQCDILLRLFNLREAKNMQSRIDSITKLALGLILAAHPSRALVVFGPSRPLYGFRSRDRRFFRVRFLISRSKLCAVGCLIQKGRWHRVFRTSITRDHDGKKVGYRIGDGIACWVWMSFWVCAIIWRLCLYNKWALKPWWLILLSWRFSYRRLLTKLPLKAWWQTTYPLQGNPTIITPCAHNEYPR